jgi:hypothetical protein
MELFARAHKKLGLSCGLADLLLTAPIAELLNMSLIDPNFFLCAMINEREGVL